MTVPPEIIYMQAGRDDILDSFRIGKKERKESYCQKANSKLQFLDILKFVKTNDVKKTLTY